MDTWQVAHAALKTGLENLGLAVATRTGGILDELWPWLSRLVQEVNLLPAPAFAGDT